MSNSHANAPEADAYLLPYQSVSGRLLAAASLLIPFGMVGFLVLYCQQAGGAYALNAPLAVDGAVQVALLIHASYFIVLPFMFELMIEQLPLPLTPSAWRFGKVPKRPDNLYWMMSCLSAELFFVAATLLFLLATQVDAPRWIFIVVLAQCAYNMKNDIVWVGLGKAFSPIRKPMSFMVADWVLIGALFAVYLQHFFAA